MKILFISFSNYDNGTYMGGGWVAALSRLLSQSAKYTVGIVYPSPMKNTPWERDNVVYYPFLHTESKWSYYKRRLTRMPFDFSIYANELNKIISDFNPDIVQLFGLESDISSLAIEVKDRPVVVHIQGSSILCSQLWYPKGLSCDMVKKHTRIADRIKHVSSIDQYLNMCNRAVVEKRNFSIYKYYLGRTSWDRGIVDFYSAGGKYYICNEAIRDVFYRYSWSNPSREVVLVTINNGEIYKGFDTILETAHLLKEHGLNFKWRIIGMEHNHPTLKLIEEIKQLHFADNNVVFEGKKQAEDIAKILCECTLYVHPSHNDNSPNSVCEAMVVGVPVVANFIGGIPSLIEHQKTGWLVPDGDSLAMASAIAEIAQDKDVLCRISEIAKQVARHRHSAENIIKELENAYSSIIEDYSSRNKMNIITQ